MGTDLTRNDFEGCSKVLYLQWNGWD